MIRSVNELRVTLWTLAFATIGVSGAPASRAAGASTAWTAGAEGAIGVGTVVATTIGTGREKRRRASRTCGGLSRRSVG